jgi:hypothetical protein
MRYSAQPLAFVLAVAIAGCGAPATAPGPLLPAGISGALTSRTTRALAAPWVPDAGSTFAVQYGGKRLDAKVPADVYDVDGFDTKASTVAALHDKSRHVVCYIDVGTWENWRPDADKFPQSVLGHPDGHWPGERWLDIRQLAVLQPLMAARFRMCKAKGFDAVDPDNIDGYTNRTGFPLTARQQLTYDRWVASAVHSLGLSVAQKNDGGQINQLRGSFDWAVLEQCAAQGWCGTFTPYSKDDRLVVDIEYGLSKSRFVNSVCPKAKGYRETALLKHLSLDAWVVTCPS